MDRTVVVPAERRVFAAEGVDSGDLEELAKLDVPTVLLDFYACVREVSLPDLGNGVFVHSARHVIAGLLGALPTRLAGAAEGRITVFGSDGGGSMFALSRRTRPPAAGRSLPRRCLRSRSTGNGSGRELEGQVVA